MTPRLLEHRSPEDDSLLGTVEIADAARVAAAVERARAAQESWAARSPAERGVTLLRVARVLARRAEDEARFIAQSSGKPLFEAWAMEVLTILEHLRHLAVDGPALLADAPFHVGLGPHRRALRRYRPRGVVGVIAPWNFPYAIPGSEIATALLAGNAVVLKPSEHTPLVGDRLQALFREGGVPEGLIEVVHGDGVTGAALLAADIDSALFTGSVATGKTVATTCAARLLPCRLELGGKAAAVVTADAPLARTAAALVWGAFVHGGQVCAGAQRIFVDSKIVDALVERMCVEIDGLVPGATIRATTSRGFYAGPNGPRRVIPFVEDAMRRGARLVRGAVPNVDDRVVDPILLRGALPDAMVLREECFGPLALVVPCASEDEMIARANDGPGDLIAYAFGGRGVAAVAQKLRAGTVMANDVVWAYGMPEAPWGGVRRSGIGRSHGIEGLHELCVVQHINLPRGPLLPRDPTWYPYNAPKLQALHQAMRLRVEASAAKLKMRALTRRGES